MNTIGVSSLSNSAYVSYQKNNNMKNINFKGGNVSSKGAEKLNKQMPKLTKILSYIALGLAEAIAVTGITVGTIALLNRSQNKNIENSIPADQTIKDTCNMSGESI